MSIQQFINTLTQINSCQHVNKSKAYYKHLFWQIRKIFNLFPFEIQISNSKIIARNKYCGVCALANCLEMYDYNIMNLIKILSQKEKVFFDVGANIGLYSLLASENKNIHIAAFEPHPKTFEQLCGNIELNQRNNIKPYKLALSDTNGKSKFTNLNESSINRFPDKTNESSIDVDVKRGVDICKELNIIPSFIKIDVEGFELEVLLGFGNILSEIKLIILEWGELNEDDTSVMFELFLINKFEGPYYFKDDSKTLSREKHLKEKNVFFNTKAKDYLLKEYSLIII